MITNTVPPFRPNVIGDQPVVFLSKPHASEAARRLPRYCRDVGCRQKSSAIHRHIACR